MKKYIIQIVLTLLPVLNILAQDRPVMGTVLLNGKEIPAEYRLSGSQAILGSGRNACIPQFSKGRLIVPATITVNGNSYDVTAVSPMAFRLCNNISFVQLPEGVESIGNFAFKGCSGLVEVALPSTLLTIGSGAFVGLSGLRGIYCPAPEPPKWEYNDVFCRHEGGIGSTKTYSNSTAILYVPMDKVELYRNSAFTDDNLGWTTPDGWRYFQNVKGTNDYETEWGLGISTPLALNNFRDRVNAGETFFEKTVKIEADIDMMNQEWDSGMGGHLGYFKGTFDGQGHTISNLRVNISDSNSPIQYLGFFSNIVDATVTNLYIDNFYLISQSNKTRLGGVISGTAVTSTISNVFVSNSQVLNFGNVGGLIGNANHSQINKCVAYKTQARHAHEGNAFDEGLGAGGLIGFSLSSTVRDCAVIGISYPNNDTQWCIKGPFVGLGWVDLDYCYSDALEYEKFVPTEDHLYTHGEHVVVLGQVIWNSYVRAYREVNVSLIKNFMALVPFLGLDNWVYCVGKYPLPDCFEDLYEVAPNHFSLRPATLTTPRPNALSPTEELSYDDWTSGNYRNASFRTSSLWIDDNLNLNDREQIPIGTATIECTNGVRYDRTLKAPSNGTRTMEYPVYQTDEDGMIVLDENGQRIPTGETETVEDPIYKPTPYSFCLPYELTFSNGIHLYKPTTSATMYDGGVRVTFNETEDGVAEAWTPYYAVVDVDSVSLSTEEHVMVTPNPHITFEAGKYIFEGTEAVTKRSTKNAYLLQDDKTWRKEGETIPPFRAYFYSDYDPQADYLVSLVAFDLFDNLENSSKIDKSHGLTVDAILRGRILSRNNAWNTICLPFDLTNLSGTPFEDATVKTLRSSSFDPETGTLTLDFQTATSIEAGKPYIVKWVTPGKDIKYPVFMDVTISGQAKNIKTDAVTFCSTFDPIKLEANDKTKLYMGGDNKLYYPSGEVPVNSFRAYFQLADGIIAGNPTNQGVKAFVLNFGDDSTYIREIERVGNESTWYTIDGRKLSGSPTRSGIYINNGQKVIVK